MTTMTTITRTTHDPVGSSATGILEDPWLTRTVSIPADRCGPPGTGNGGWVAGTLAGHLGSGPVTVTLHAPTPLEVPLEVRAADDVATLSHEGRLLASAQRSSAPIRTPGFVGRTAAAGASARFPGHHDHPFPGCFSCGTTAEDGLGIHPGPLDDGTGWHAAVLTPRASHAGAHGRLGTAAVWAALDCVTAWVNMTDGMVAVLGRIRAEVTGEVQPGQDHVVVASSRGVTGRKAYGRAALYDLTGRRLAASEATWIAIEGAPAP